MLNGNYDSRECRDCSESDSSGRSDIRNISDSSVIRDNNDNGVKYT